MLTWLVTSISGDKGILLKAEDSDKALKLAMEYYYSPFEWKKDLNVTQVYEPNKHRLVSASGNRIFSHVQFNTMGGVATSYNCTIDIQPTQQQLDFLGKEIQYVKFFAHETLRY